MNLLDDTLFYQIFYFIFGSVIELFSFSITKTWRINDSVDVVIDSILDIVKVNVVSDWLFVVLATLDNHFVPKAIIDF